MTDLLSIVEMFDYYTKKHLEMDLIYVLSLFL